MPYPRFGPHGIACVLAIPMPYVEQRLDSITLGGQSRHSPRRVLYGLFGMSLDENRVARELSPSMDEKAIFHQLTRMWTTHGVRNSQSMDARAFSARSANP